MGGYAVGGRGRLRAAFEAVARWWRHGLGEGWVLHGLGLGAGRALGYGIRIGGRSCLGGWGCGEVDELFLVMWEGWR